MKANVKMMVKVKIKDDHNVQGETQGQGENGR